LRTPTGGTSPRPGDATFAPRLRDGAFPIYTGDSHLGLDLYIGLTTAAGAQTILRLAAGAIRRRTRPRCGRRPRAATSLLGAPDRRASITTLALPAMKPPPRASRVRQPMSQLRWKAQLPTGRRPDAKLADLAAQSFGSTEADVGLSNARAHWSFWFRPREKSMPATPAPPRRCCRGAGRQLKPAIAVSGAASGRCGSVGRRRSQRRTGSSRAANRPTHRQRRARLRVRRLGCVSAVARNGAGADALRAFAQSTLAPLRAYDENTKPNSNGRCASTSRRAKRQDSLRNNSTSTVTPSSIDCDRSAISPRARWKVPTDQLTLRMAIAIDAIHS